MLPIQMQIPHGTGNLVLQPAFCRIIYYEVRNRLKQPSPGYGRVPMVGVLAAGTRLRCARLRWCRGRNSVRHAKRSLIKQQAESRCFLVQVTRTRRGHRKPRKSGVGKTETRNRRDTGKKRGASNDVILVRYLT
jgi:hypothetical protein